MNDENQTNATLSVIVHESVSVSSALIIGVIVVRLSTGTTSQRKNETLVSVAEYRRLLDDNTSTDAQVVERLQYLESFCRSIIKPAIQIYENKTQ